MAELIDYEFIIETGPGESSGGRRPVMLTFNKDAGYSIGGAYIRTSNSAC
jgi:hypothetical protein